MKSYSSAGPRGPPRRVPFNPIPGRTMAIVIVAPFHIRNQPREVTIVKIYPEFPPHRREDPKRRAELKVYQAIEQSPRPGCALYELKTSRHTPELDFSLLAEDIGVAGLQVKGGPHQMVRGQFQRITDDGPVAIADPIALCWDSTMQIREVVQAKLHKSVFVTPFLVFPDMERDPAIEARAADAKVKTIFGTVDLVEAVISGLYDEEIYRPPSAHLVQRIAETLFPYLADEDDDDPEPDLCNGVRRPRPQDPSPTGEARPEPAGNVDLTGLQPVIGHADVVHIETVNVYQGAAAPAGGVAPEEEVSTD